MTDLGAPLPPEEQFWSFASDGELRFQRCEACGTWRYPPTEICARCLSPEATWIEVSGRAVLLSYVVVRQGPDERRTFPYLVLHGALEEGIRYTANAVGDVAPGDLRIGMPLRLAISGEGNAKLPQYVFAGCSASGPE